MRILARLVVAVLLAATVTAAGAAAVAWHAGYRAYVVRSGSMAPAYPAGTLIVDMPLDGRPHVGDVITFRTPAGPVTHRVHSVQARRIETKGDANRTPDAWTVAPRHVTGQVVRAVPRGGYALVFLQQPTGIPSLVLLTLSMVLAWSLFFPATQPDPEARQPAEPDQPSVIDLTTGSVPAAV
jgi:signal peptidase